MAQGKLLEYAAETLKDSEFGLHLAQKANPREVGLLFYVASAADDIGDALALTALLPHCQRSGASEARSLSGGSEN